MRQSDYRSFRRLAVLMEALADLAECAGARCALVRCLVLWFLRPAEAAAYAYAVGAGAPPHLLAAFLAEEAGETPSDALRLANTFRTLAAVFNALAHRARLAPLPPGLPKLAATIRDLRNWLDLATPRPGFADTS